MSVILTMSDAHVGKRTKGYSVSEFRRMFRRYIMDVVRELSRVERFYDVKDVNLFMLGDNVDGETIYPAQAFDLEMTVVESLKVLSDAVGELIDELLGLGYKVNVYGVAGNHGRANKNGRSNWEVVVYEMLKEKYDTQGLVNVKYSEWYVYEEVGGLRVLGVHGDQIRMYQNIPIYGVVQRAMRWQESIGEFQILLLGHFHTTYYIDWNGILIFGSGTMLSDDDWTRRLGLKPSLKWWGLGIVDGKLEWVKLFNLRGGGDID